jgi:hypothetical protein
MKNKIDIEFFAAVDTAIAATRKLIDACRKRAPAPT